jgi:protein O-mannosyl-transferase
MSEPTPESAQISDLKKTTEAPVEPAGKSPMTSAIFVYVLLAAITMFTFWPAVHFDFVNLDDPDYIGNWHVQKGLTLSGIVWAFGTWHPITWISHMLDAQFFGTDPTGPHFVNLLLHVANSVLLFVVLNRLFEASAGQRKGPSPLALSPSDGETEKTSAPLGIARPGVDGFWASAFVAALFALHPLQVESVAWVAERKGVLSTFFFMLTLWAYTSYVIKKNAGEGEKPDIRKSTSFVKSTTEVKKLETSSKFQIRNSRTYYILALVFFALGLLSKPMLVTVPILLLLLDFWPLRRVARVGSRVLVLEKTPFFALAVGSGILTLVTQGRAGAFQSLEHYSGSSRFENGLMSYWHYLGKIFWPVGLATPYPRTFHFPLFELALGALLLVTLCAVAFWRRRNWPFLAVGWLWFLVALMPVNGMVQAAAQTVSDRYAYLASIGLFILVTWAVQGAVARGWIPRTLCGFIAGILLLVCAVRTRDQLAVWRNSETLFQHALAVTRNNVIAQYNLGTYYQDHQRPDEALACYRRTLAMKPGYADALNNIGYVLMSQKKFGEAIQTFEAALKSNPNSVEARNNIGYALCMAGKTDEGIAQYRLALKSKPEHIGVLNNLGNALAQRRQFKEAIPYYEASLRANPEQATAQYGLAHALDSSGQHDQAIDHYRLATFLNPNYAEPHYDLGLTLARKGQFEESVKEFREAVRLKPENATFHFGLGKALGIVQKFDESIVAYQEGLRIAPTNAEAFSGIGSALATKGKLEQAVPYFKQSIRIRPENPFTHYFLAKALSAQRKFDEAAPQFSEALRLKPDFHEAKQELDTIRARGK